MAIVLALMAAAATLPAFADVDALLREIAAYEYGDSLEAQMAMDAVIREASGARAARRFGAAVHRAAAIRRHLARETIRLYETRRNRR